ncbi:hypothetical protein PAHAL_3G178800 [Panicum hallii]|uniref:Uncharacterized protein n=1 Tax=Panicum hallii TaxID=206008 RepID=A0A2T8KIJ7_9POAL|nr:hypothetical protein PAHAL_3G178800 [Panicum hallii]
MPCFKRKVNSMTEFVVIYHSVLDALSLDKMPSKHFLNKTLQDKWIGFSPLRITTVNQY